MSASTSKRDVSPSDSHEPSEGKRIKLDEEQTMTATAGEAVDPSSPTIAISRTNNRSSREYNTGKGREQRDGRGSKAGRGARGSGRGTGTGRGTGNGNGRRSDGKTNDRTNNKSDRSKEKQRKNDKILKDEVDDNAGSDADGQPKLPKKKVALLIGYSGLGYCGSQV